MPLAMPGPLDAQLHAQCRGGALAADDRELPSRPPRASRPSAAPRPRVTPPPSALTLDGSRPLPLLTPPVGEPQAIPLPSVAVESMVSAPSRPQRASQPARTWHTSRPPLSIVAALAPSADPIPPLPAPSGRSPVVLAVPVVQPSPAETPPTPSSTSASGNATAAPVDRELAHRELAREITSLVGSRSSDSTPRLRAPSQDTPPVTPSRHTASAQRTPPAQRTSQAQPTPPAIYLEPLVPRAPRPPQKAPSRYRSWLYAAGLLVLCGPLAGRFVTAGPSSSAAPHAHTPFAAAALQQELAEAERARNWTQVLASANQLLQDPVLSPPLREQAQAALDRAAQEQQNQIVYDRFLDAAARKAYDASVLTYAELPVESVYRQIGAARYAEMQAGFARVHLERALGSLQGQDAARGCREAQPHIDAILAVAPPQVGGPLSTLRARCPSPSAAGVAAAPDKTPAAGPPAAAGKSPLARGLPGTGPHALVSAAPAPPAGAEQTPDVAQAAPYLTATDDAPAAQTP